MDAEIKPVEDSKTLEERVEKLEAQMARMNEKKAVEAAGPATESEKQAPSFGHPPSSGAPGGGIMSRRKW